MGGGGWSGDASSRERHARQILDQTRRLAAELQKAVEDRVVVEQALGIVISRSGGAPEETLDRLDALSRSEHRTLVAVAHSIVEDAVRRAQARRAGDGHV